MIARADLHFGELHLVLAALDFHVEEADAPYGAWIRCGVEVDVPGFRGRFDWSVMPSELARLAGDLEALHREVPTIGTLAFHPLEPGVGLALTLQQTGQIAGSYVLQPEGSGSPELRGEFRIDQSYLPALAAGVRRFVSDVTATS